MTEARYCYNGPAFRFQPQGDNRAHPREFRQAGIECFGDSDTESADVEIVLLAVEAVRRAGLKDLRLRFGDIALFYALLDALALPERWRLKLRHYFWRPIAFHALLARLARGERPNGDGPVMALADTLAGEAPDRAEELVAAYLEAQGLPLAGNRTLGEIAARLLDHAADLRADPLRKEVATVIDSYLAVSGPPKEAVERVAAIAKGAGIDLGAFALVLRAPLRASREERHRPCARDLRHRVRPQPRILLGPGVPDRGRRRSTTPSPAAAAMTACSPISARAREVPAIGSAIHTERLLAAVRGTVLMAAKLSDRGSLQGPAQGRGRRSVRARGPRLAQQGTRAPLSRRAFRARRRRGGLHLRGRDRAPAQDRAACISA